MAGHASPTFHQLPVTLNGGDLGVSAPTTIGLKIVTATVVEGTSITAKLVRESGSILSEVTAEVGLSGIPRESLPIPLLSMPVTIPAGLNEIEFSFATKALDGDQAATGTLSIISSVNAVIGTSPVTFDFQDAPPVPPADAKPVVQWVLPARAAGDIPEINEDPTKNIYYRAQVTRTVPSGQADTGLIVYWTKNGYEEGDITRYTKSGRTVFPVGTLTMPFDVEAIDVGGDRLITCNITDHDDYTVGQDWSFQVRIKNLTPVTPDPERPPETNPPIGDDWWKSKWTRNSKNVLVSRYNRNFMNVSPNFFSPSQHASFDKTYGAFDAVNGSGTRSFRGQTWEQYIGGPVSKGPTYVDPNSWLTLESDHIREWWNRARTQPDLWLIINCLSMPSYRVDNGTRPTEAVQLQIIEDIIAGRLNADIQMAGARLRHQIENAFGAVRKGCADRVLLRPNWEFQHTTSLSIGGDDFMDKFKSRGLSSLDAAKKYRDMMAVWSFNLRKGYDSAGVKLRIACSVCQLAWKGVSMNEFIKNASDYDMVDMMNHPNKDNCSSADQMWNVYYKPATASRYNFANGWALAEKFGLPIGSLEAGPVYADARTTVRTFIAPNSYAANKPYENKYYVINGANDVYWCITKGPGNSTVTPTHKSGDVTGSDGYKWRWVINKGRKLSPYEFHEIVFANFLRDTGRATFLGSFNASSCNPNYVHETWTAAERDASNPTSMASEWKRFVEMRQWWMSKRPE